MILISSVYTKFYKKVFPAIFLSVFAIILLNGLVWVFNGGEAYVLPLIGGALIVGSIAMALFKSYAWRLVDEVGFDGEVLEVVNGEIRVRIALCEIQNIHFAEFSPPFVEIFLKQERELGSEILFIPPFGEYPTRKHSAIEGLIQKFKDQKA